MLALLRARAAFASASRSSLSFHILCKEQPLRTPPRPQEKLGACKGGARKTVQLQQVLVYFGSRLHTAERQHFLPAAAVHSSAKQQAARRSCHVINIQQSCVVVKKVHRRIIYILCAGCVGRGPPSCMFAQSLSARCLFRWPS